MNEVGFHMFTYLLFRNKVIFVKWESVLVHRSGHVLTRDLVRYIHERLQFSLQLISLAWTITEKEIVESIKLRHKLGSFTIEEVWKFDSNLLHNKLDPFENNKDNSSVSPKKLQCLKDKRKPNFIITLRWFICSKHLY